MKILKAFLLVALSAWVPFHAHADGVQPIVPPAGVLFGSNQHTIISSAAAVSIDTTTFQFNVKKHEAVDKLIFPDGTSMTSTGTFSPAPLLWGNIGGTLSNQTDLQSQLTSINAKLNAGFPVSLSTGVIGSLSLSALANGTLGPSIIASSVAVNTVGISQLNLSGTANSSTFARGDGLWVSSSTFGAGNGVSVYPATSTIIVPQGATIGTMTVSGTAIFNSTVTMNVNSTTVSNPLILGNSNANNVTGEMLSFQSGTNLSSINGEIISYRDDVGAGDMAFLTNTSSIGGSPTEKMRIMGGNDLSKAIGIGTTNPQAYVEVVGNVMFDGVTQSTFSGGVTMASVSDLDLSANSFVQTDAAKHLISVNPFANSNSWTAPQTFVSTTSSSFTYGLFVGSITLSGVSNTLVAANGFGVLVATTVTANVVITSSAIPFGSPTNGLATDVTNLNWNDTTNTLMVSSITVSTISVTGSFIGNANKTVFNTTSLLASNPAINQTSVGPVATILNLEQNGTIGASLEKRWYGSSGPPSQNGAFIISNTTGAQLWLDGTGAAGIDALQNGTTFYVAGNMVVGAGLSSQATTSARPSGLYVLGGVDISSNVVVTSSVTANVMVAPVANLTQVSASSVTLSGFMQLTPKTHTQITALTPGATNQVYACSDCSTVPVCISTGVVSGAWSLITAKTSACQ